MDICPPLVRGLCTVDSVYYVIKLMVCMGRSAGSRFQVLLSNTRPFLDLFAQSVLHFDARPNRWACCRCVYTDGLACWMRHRHVNPVQTLVSLMLIMHHPLV